VQGSLPTLGGKQGRAKSGVVIGKAVWAKKTTHLAAQFYVYVDISCVASKKYIETHGT
jgi:hypothetical protein